MATSIETLRHVIWAWGNQAKTAPKSLIFATFLAIVVSILFFFYAALFFLVPKPRAPLASERTYITSDPSTKVTKPRNLPCWHDVWLQNRQGTANSSNTLGKYTSFIDEPEIEMSVVVPAYNEEERLTVMLEEAVEYLEAEYGRKPKQLEKSKVTREQPSGHRVVGGYEILIVNDGSSDKTVEVALEFGRRHNLHDILRVCTLKTNRGKGGAVIHGFRHVRGAYALFADADGASRFTDVHKLVEGCKEVVDASGRAVSVGSRAHLVESEAVVKRSLIRNVLMHSFHLLLRLLTPPATSRIRDTQCGFKLFSRPALPYIVPYMHAEGWIFDVEMLMLAESAPPALLPGGGETDAGIRVKEVFIGWKEVGGSKLNVICDSLGMAYGLALLRAGWMLGVYRRW
ncbi:BgTH12-04466 [Blumeria graminis f. sp. triticale]|uniref:dolichyl-phosphate beta-glucosyltransferase n=1 Tax=Blumeria graminis f. sp. triticale TaxID=1689686 RepID=A0A9W4CUW0_BLUGR|nr:BgTH12-04466 [Blumeria graminis f. sp. triticale]